MKLVGVALFTGFFLLSAPEQLSAANQQKMSASCIHAMGAATRAFADLVSDQLVELKGPDRALLAHNAIALTQQLNCPKGIVLKSIECIVAYIHSTNKRPGVPEVVGCVKQVSGQSLFEK